MDFSTVFYRIVLVVCCLAGPILWGIVVNWLFISWPKRSRNQSANEDDPVFPDYQI